MFVSDIFSFHFQGMHDCTSQHMKVGAEEEKEATIEEAKAFLRQPILNLHKEDKNFSQGQERLVWEQVVMNVSALTS